jgi:catechol 2,3-dioxygenase-like lactoylglutathione lyase family enzyme
MTNNVRFNHCGPQFAVESVTKSIEFYSDVLGFGIDYLSGSPPAYAGDYFPLEEGYTLNYSGSVDMLTEMTIPGYDSIEEPTNVPNLVRDVKGSCLK